MGTNEWNVDSNKIRIRLSPFVCQLITRVPIHCPIPIRNLTQPEFDECDKIVMRCAYASQNTLGRMCDERVYETDLALRLRAEGMNNVHTQTPVTVTHDGFEKVYRLDLLANNALYELKAATALAAQHDAQILHYAMLLAVNHAKLLNFRPGKVQGQLRFNIMMSAERRRMVWDESGWRPLTGQCKTVHARLRSLMEDWGGFLDTHLYEEALIHFCGGETQVVCRVPILRDDFELGTQSMNSHEPGLGFVVTSFRDSDRQRAHLQRLLDVSQMRALQWFNFNRAVVECVTLEKQ